VKRREFITLLSGAAATWPIEARAQRAIPIIGVLYPNSADFFAPSLEALRKGLREAEFVDGENVAIQFRSAEGNNDRLPALAAEFVARKVAIIVTGGGPLPVRAAMTATSTIPILFLVASDPIEFGLVSNINRPGGNVTGVARLSTDLLSKRLELLREIVPVASSIAVLMNSTAPTSARQVKELQEASHALGVPIQFLKASTVSEIDAAFESLGELRLGALLIAPDSFFNSRHEQLAALALRHRMPASHQLREFAVAGGLMSYGSSLLDGYRQVGMYAGRILKGEKPADLPVQQSVRFDLVLNLKTARAIGLDLSPKMLALADEVIE
jgi:putative ABC transport system substrate-binding protein